MLRTLTHSRERLLKSLPPRLAESSAATSTGTMA